MHSRFDHFVHIGTILGCLLGGIRSVISEEITRVGRSFVQIVWNMRKDIVQAI